MKRTDPTGQHWLQRDAAIILNTAQVLNHGTYLRIVSQEIECGYVCLSFRKEADLGSFSAELSKWSDRTVESAWEISENMIGRGAQGAVYHGTSRQGTNQGMAVAVKIMNGIPEGEVFINVYLEEHENVMVALDVLRDEKSTYIVMPYLKEAENLKDFLARKQFSIFGRLNLPKIDKAKLYMRQILSAVAHLHAAGISHGDLHWENVMVQHNVQKVTIIDFGFSNFKFSRQRNDLSCCGMILHSMQTGCCMGAKVRDLIDFLIGGKGTVEEALNHTWLQDAITAESKKFGFWARIFGRKQHNVSKNPSYLEKGCWRFGK